MERPIGKPRNGRGMGPKGRYSNSSGGMAKECFFEIIRMAGFEKIFIHGDLHKHNVVVDLTRKHNILCQMEVSLFGRKDGVAGLRRRVEMLLSKYQ